MSQSQSLHQTSTLTSAAKPRSLIVHYLGRVERLVLSFIAVILVVLAILLLVSSAVSMIRAALDGEVGKSAIEILDGVLLVMMTMEIVYTVTLSIESHKLAAEPFLIIGIIAAIRRSLVITAESTRLENNPEAFRSTLIELGLLAFIVGVMAVSIFIIRRAPRTAEEVEAEKELVEDER